MNNKDTENKLTKSQQALVDVILEKLNDGHIPWDDGLHHYGRVHNASTGVAYRGQNALLLTILSQAKFDGEPRYMTFNQAKEKGYHVKKGAKGVPIDIYKIIDKRTNKEVDVVAVKKEMEAMTDEEARTFQKENLYALPKSYTVFNAKDIAGIPPLEITPTDERLRNERIERLIANSPAPITYDGNGNNYYSPSHDEIHLTDRKQYKAIESNKASKYLIEIEKNAQKTEEHVATSRKEQTVNLRITEEERELLNEFVDSWKESNNERMEIIDFGVNRPTSPDFWIGLEILGEVERSDAKFSVKFDRTHVHNVSIKTIDEKEYIESQKPQPTEQIPQNENGQKDKTVPLVPVPHEFITNTQAIPEEMKKLNNWVAFRSEVGENGKYKKTLLDPNK